MAEVVESGRTKLLGQRVKDLRLGRGLALGELGGRLGIGAPAVCNLERRGVDRISTLEALAWALECDLVVELRPRVGG